MVKIIYIVLGFTCQEICGSKNWQICTCMKKWHDILHCVVIIIFFNKKSVKNCKSSQQYIPTAYKGVKRVSMSQVLLGKCIQCYKSRWFLAVWSAAFRCVLHNVKTSRVILLLISPGFSLITHNWKTFKTSNWPQGQTMQLYLRLHRPQLVC